MKKEEVFRLWKDVGEVCVFGFGHTCKNSLERVRRFGAVSCILDNSAKLDGERFRDVPIRYFDGSEGLLKTKILISTHYSEICAQLQGYGLREDVDFISLEKYLIIMEWFALSRVFIGEVHMTVTTKCTLSCRKCNMFMPKYKQAHHYPIDEMKSNIDAMFGIVDRVGTLTLLGGETFLYPDLSELIRYIFTRWHGRYDVMEVLTNGTIEPKESVLETLRECGVFVRISDYSAAIPYAAKLNRFAETLDQYGIEHYANSELTWLDFGFPDHPICVPDEKVYEHMMACSPAFKGLNGKKLYYCHVLWSANECGLYDERAGDYFDLAAGEREGLVDYLIGDRSKPISLCKYCAGCGSDNKNVIPVAVQET